MKELIKKDTVYKTYLTNEELDINITSKDIHKNPTILKDEVDENYKFYHKNIFFKIFAFLLYCLAFVVFYPYNAFVVGVKVKGRKNLKHVKNAVFIANHTFALDCVALSTHVLRFRRPIFVVNKDSFQIPVARTLIKGLMGVPLPENNLKTYRKFLTETDNELKNGKSLLIYPEGSLWPFYAKIRPLNSGAFRFSIKNNLPIVPIVVSFRRPNKIQRMFGKLKPQVTLTILKPYFVNPENPTKQESERLNAQIYAEMQQVMQKENSYIYIKEDI